MTKRRVFISFQHKDRNKAKGFNLLRWNKNVEADFIGRHLLDPVNSENEAYIRSKIAEQLKGTSVTVVLVGGKTCNSTWVEYEIEKSVEKGNGILAIRLDGNAALPKGSPVHDALKDAGAEIIDWDSHEFGDAIERAFNATKRINQIKNARPSSRSCQR
jgi:hypothetical protein